MGKPAQPASQSSEPDESELPPPPPPPSTGATARLNSKTAAPLRRSNGLPSGGKPVQSAKSLELPLQPIIDALPLELQPRLKFSRVGELTISISLEQVLSQLSRGSVKITFGELRRSAPQVFAPEADRDMAMVPLPLSEILSRLSPSYIVRRRVQKQVELPPEISSPFGNQGQGFVFSVGPGKAGAEAPPPAPAHHRPSAPLPASPVSPAIPARAGITFAPTPPPPAATFAPAPPPAAAPAPRQPAMISATRALRELSASPSPVAPAAPVPAQAPPIPFPQAVPKPGPEVETLLVALTALAEAWPDAVRKEIVDFNLVDARVALPVDLVGQALRQGRIAFSWKTLRTWVVPATLTGASAHDGVVLELPLKVVAPLFLAKQQDRTKQKVAVSAEIPNLFFGVPQPEAGSAAAPAESNHAVAKAEDTNFYVWGESSDTVQMHESEFKRTTTPGTSFVGKYATPNEVVSRAAALEGVSGALIALPDGLMVASRLAADLNGDTLAAFLPHIFGKVSQCTKELRMGELNNLNFTVGNVPWKIFRVNAIFFAAFGRAGQALPTSQLAALASELDHKPK